MKRVLLVGATGLIGSHLLRELLVDNIVYVISRTKPEEAGAIWISQDLTKVVDWDKLPSDLDSIIYLAQSEHFRDFPEHVSKVLWVNTVQVVEFLDFARRTGVKDFIFASSGGVYGGGDSGFTEDSVIDTDTRLGFYLSTKLCSEILLENYRNIFRTVIFRFFFVYGPGQKESMLIPRLSNSIKTGTSVNLDGQDGLKINPTHVSDAVGALMAALNSKVEGKFNVAGPEALSLREICNIISQYIDIAPNFTVRAETDPHNIIGDIEKLKRKLYRPSVSFEEGIKSMLDVPGGKI